MKNTDPIRLSPLASLDTELCTGCESSAQPWMVAFGKLRHLRNENSRINRIIEKEFEKIEHEDGCDRA